MISCTRFCCDYTTSVTSSYIRWPLKYENNHSSLAFSKSQLWHTDSSASGATPAISPCLNHFNLCLNCKPESPWMPPGSWQPDWLREVWKKTRNWLSLWAQIKWLTVKSASTAPSKSMRGFWIVARPDSFLQICGLSLGRKATQKQTLQQYLFQAVLSLIMASIVYNRILKISSCWPWSNVFW